MREPTADVASLLPDRAAMRAVGVRRGYRQAKSSIGRAPRLASVLSAARVAAACDGGRAACGRVPRRTTAARAPHEGA
ncbi:hypothetical protein [Burkholderia pseudomallei]|uniref:hypothetical protein n=1 Tax=Burkholderia pseudomallei TaxID=28450 RepID=UPI0018AB2318|nr:hypothetical protein [Burkholderia pseudomallei]